MNDYQSNLNVPEKLVEEVRYLEGVGYKIKSVHNEVVELRKWKSPPISFLFYIVNLPFFPALIINWLFGYNFRTFVYESNEEIIVSNNPPKDVTAK